MSITSDLRSYADKAQAQLNDVTGQANDFVVKYRDNVSSVADKATEAVTDLRTSAEKVINLDAIREALEPYLNRIKGYGNSVTDRAESVLNDLKKDSRFAKIVDTAESLTETVLAQVEDLVVKPVQSFTNRGGSAPVTKPAPAPTAKPAAAKATAKKPAATKPAATPTKSKPAARKAPSKRSAKA